MFQSLGRKKSSLPFRIGAFFVILAFSINLIIPPTKAYAQSVLNLPNPGVMVTLTSGFVPPMLKGMKVDQQHPFQFDFIFDSGNANLTRKQLKQEANKLIKYFLASLTIPEEDLWVNLSPYEKDRIIPDEFGITEMGRDLLAQDYVLKQLTASLIYPEEDLGKEFWDRVYSKARQLYGTEEIPINTFNKVWILPDKAVVYENETIVFVLESHLKVMLEGDYLALRNNISNKEIGSDQLQEEEIRKLNNISSQFIREVVIPEVEKEVNHGQNFAKLRQVYHSLILAKWYKQNLKQSILNREYSDQKKIIGIDIDDKSAKEKIYERYLEAFKKGVFNYIKEDYDTVAQQVIPRKYFSGGMNLKINVLLEKKTGVLSPEDLAKADTAGKLSWIRGIYRRPRVSPRYINNIFGDEIREGRAQKIDAIEYEGIETATYEIPVPLSKAGQYGHIGLGEKEIRNGEIVYKDDADVVVYLLKEVANNPIVRNHEGLKAKRIREKMQLEGERRKLGRALTPLEMRSWIKENVNGEASEFLRKIDSEAEKRHPLEPLYRKAEQDGLSPTDEFIAHTYTQAEDFRDLNLAAGRTVTIEDLRRAPTDVLDNTSVVLKNVLLFEEKLENPESMSSSEVRALGLLMEKGIVNQRVIKEMMIVEKLVYALKDDGSKTRKLNAVELIGKSTLHWGDWKDEIIPELLKIIRDKSSTADLKIAATNALGNSASQWGDFRSEVVTELLKRADFPFEEWEKSYLKSNFNKTAAVALGKGIAVEGEAASVTISVLTEVVKEPFLKETERAAEALGYGLSKRKKLANDIVPVLLEALKNDKTGLPSEKVAPIIGRNSAHWNQWSNEIVQELLELLKDRDRERSRVAAKALGDGASQWGELNDEVVQALSKVIHDRYDMKGTERLRVTAAQALGKGALRLGDSRDGIISRIVSDSNRMHERGFGDYRSDVNVGMVKALGYIMAQGGELAKETVPTLVRAVFSNWDTRVKNSNLISVEAVGALGKGLPQGGNLARDIIHELVKALGDKKEGVRAAALQVLGENPSQWGERRDNIMMALVDALDEADLDVRTASARALGNVEPEWGEWNSDILLKLQNNLTVKRARRDSDSRKISNLRIASLEALGQSSPQLGESKDQIINILMNAISEEDQSWEKDKEAEVAADALGSWVEKEYFQTLSMRDILDYYLFLQEERKREKKDELDDDANVRRVQVLIARSIIEGKIDPEDVRYAGELVDSTESKEPLKKMLSGISGWAVEGSIEAQMNLEEKITQLVSNKAESGPDYLSMPHQDELLIDAVSESTSQRSLVQIFVSRKFHPEVRTKVMMILAENGYIDAGYAKLDSESIERYLSVVSDIYEQTESRIVAIVRMVDRVHEGTLDIVEIENNLEDALVGESLGEYISGKKELTVETVEYGDGGNSVTNFPNFMHDVLTDVPGMKIDRPGNLPIQSPIASNVIPVYDLTGNSPVALLKDQPTRRYGRTLEYRNTKRKKAVHFKFLKVGESADILSYEHDMMGFLKSKKDEWGLIGEYPEGIIRIGRIKVSDVPEDHLKEIQEKEGEIEVDMTDGYYTFMVYEANLDEHGNNNFYTYLNDPDLTHEEFERGLSINVHDRFVMARHGLYDTEIIELFHNRSGGQGGMGRRYDILVDLKHHQNIQQGAGRIDNVTGATLYPNVRLSGVADFAGIKFYQDIVDEQKEQGHADNRMGRLINLMDKDPLQAQKYIQSALLADTQLSLYLIVPTYLSNRGELNFEEEKKEGDTLLGRSIRTLFEGGHIAFTDSNNIPDEVKSLDVTQMKNETAFYLTNAYVDVLNRHNRPEVLPASTMEVFGEGKNEGWDDERGWDVNNKSYTIPSRNPSLTVTQRSRDLGYVNGFNPVQEMVKSVYVTTTLMTVGRYALNMKEDKAMMASSDDNSFTKTNTVQNPGGIDFNLDLLEIEIQGQGRDFNLPKTDGNFERIRIDEGLLPVIINITPITNLPVVLGTVESEVEPLAFSNN